jgi:hypothetical protein
MEDELREKREPTRRERELLAWVDELEARLTLAEAHVENLIERVYALENGLENGDG